MKWNSYNKQLILLLVFAISSAKLGAQEEKDNDFGISFSGFVKNDVFFDSRQTVAVRDGHFLLWPAAPVWDNEDNDINAKSNFNMLAVQSRLSGSITGPDALGAQTSGKIEGDFFGQANDNINLFRLRHAFVKLTWQSSELLIGQYWNPMFVTAAFPGTVSFNTGVPFQPFARNPQVRFVKHTGNLSVIAAALGQRDYASRNFNNKPDVSLLRNAALPDLHFQVHYKFGNGVIGAGTAYKSVVPELVTDSLYKTDSKVQGLSAIGFAKVSLSAVTIKVEGVYGQNNPDVLQTSGFAVKDIDPATGEKEYLPLQNMSLWMDIHTNGKKLQAGLFTGYSENMGTSEAITGGVYGLGTSIDSMYRISPRVILNHNKLRFAAECEYTSAKFGSGYTEKAVPTDFDEANNIRLLISTYYFF